MGIFNLGKYNGIVWSTVGFMLLVATLLSYNYFNTRASPPSLAIKQVQKTGTAQRDERVGQSAGGTFGKI